MCGRFTIKTGLTTLGERFHFDPEGLTFQPRFNLPPTDEALTVINEDGRKALAMRWGLIPYSAKELPKGRPIINARDDSVVTNGLFKNALTRRRCLILAEGFYEWRKDGKLRTPFYYTLKGGETFAFAGLWSIWKNPSNGEVVNSCAIVTTAPNDLTAQVHDRMPVILPEEAEEFWLNPAIVDPSVLTAALRPFPAGSMDVYEVSRAVNSVVNDSADLVLPFINAGA